MAFYYYRVSTLSQDNVATQLCFLLRQCTVHLSSSSYHVDVYRCKLPRLSSSNSSSSSHILALADGLFVDLRRRRFSTRSLLVVRTSHVFIISSSAQVPTYPSSPTHGLHVGPRTPRPVICPSPEHLPPVMFKLIMVRVIGVMVMFGVRVSLLRSGLWIGI